MSSELLDEAGVIGKFGVPAGRIVDYLALIGDTVDNVPGVDKVGSQDGDQVAGAVWLARRDHRCRA
jgi:5'-3' exonuclease